MEKTGRNVLRPKPLFNLFKMNAVYGVLCCTSTSLKEEKKWQNILANTDLINILVNLNIEFINY